MLIIPEIAELRKYADQVGLAYVNENGAKDEVLLSSIPMKSYERPMKWDYDLALFTQENNMLTPKLSMRRANILKVHGPRILAMYTSEAGVAIRKYVPSGLEQHD